MAGKLTDRLPQPLSGDAELTPRLLELAAAFRGRRVLVVGDLIADEFIYGEVARVSREAPVLILKYDTTQVIPGGAGNAAANVAALGGRVTLAGIVGTDPEGRRLFASIPREVDRRTIVKSRQYRTPVKTRILAGGTHSAKQQVVRIDRETGWPLSEEVSRTFAERLGPALDTCDAVVLSDYGSGLITPALAAVIVQALAARQGHQAIPVLLDSRFRLLEYRGLTACTPNESEVEHALGVQIDDEPDTLERAGRALLGRTRSQAVLVTRGSKGMALFEPKRQTVHVPIHGSDEVTDVTGAGDTVIATFALALASGASFYEATRLANYAGAVVVMKRGTATVSARELADAVAHDHDQGAGSATAVKASTPRTGRTRKTSTAGESGRR
jgi:rfaE bifunctional protein kinase chain/domain